MRKDFTLGPGQPLRNAGGVAWLMRDEEGSPRNTATDTAPTSPRFRETGNCSPAASVSLGAHDTHAAEEFLVRRALCRVRSRFTSSARRIAHPEGRQTSHGSISKEEVAT